MQLFWRQEGALKKLIKLVLCEVGLELTKHSQKITGAGRRRHTALNSDPANILARL